MPLGLRGTVIGVIKAARAEDFSIEVLFDEEFHGGLSIRSSPGKAYRVPITALINITHGKKKLKGDSDQKILNKPMAIVQPIDQGQHSKPPPPQPCRSLKDYKGKEASPGPAAKHVTPPDPRSLPTPTDFLPSGEKSGSMSMDQLWNALQQGPAATPQIQQEYFGPRGRGSPMHSVRFSLIFLRFQ